MSNDTVYKDKRVEDAIGGLNTREGWPRCGRMVEICSQHFYGVGSTRVTELFALQTSHKSAAFTTSFHAPTTQLCSSAYEVPLRGENTTSVSVPFTPRTPPTSHTRACSLTQAGLELLTFPHQLPACWDKEMCTHTEHHQACVWSVLGPRLLSFRLTEQTRHWML